MKVPILGYFVFINMGNGCLTSKFSNLSSRNLLSEAAIRTNNPHPNDPWIGEYISVWIDNLLPNSTQGRLIISSPSLGKYRLVWHNENQERPRIYWGEGMVFNDQLIGSYWNEIIRSHFPDQDFW